MHLRYKHLIILLDNPGEGLFSNEIVVKLTELLKTVVGKLDLKTNYGTQVPTRYSVISTNCHENLNLFNNSNEQECLMNVLSKLPPHEISDQPLVFSIDHIHQGSLRVSNLTKGTFNPNEVYQILPSQKRVKL